MGIQLDTLLGAVGLAGSVLAATWYLSREIGDIRTHLELMEKYFTKIDVIDAKQDQAKIEAVLVEERVKVLDSRVTKLEWWNEDR